MSTTESSSTYQHLEKMSVLDLLSGINREDKTVPEAIEKILPDIARLVSVVVGKMKLGGRLFYIGAGTSGRLGIVDASEIPPTFGLAHGKVIGIMAGGDRAIRQAVEFAEDDRTQAWKDLQHHHICPDDVLIGIAASGRTPYVIGGLQEARKHHVVTGCITCNQGSDLAREADYPIVAVVGPEFVTGSTRMKAGTAQKLILNMISTAAMIQLGHVQGNKMVDMQLTNHKLIERGTRMIMEELRVTADEAATLLKMHGSVRKAINSRR